MLLTRIEVENFRGLRSAVIDLGETTALIGENSAGKTTLLDAIAICCTGPDDVVTLEVRDFRQQGQAPPAERLGIAVTFEGTETEWAEPSRAAFRPFVRADATGRRTLRLELSGTRNPERNTVDATWTFTGEQDRSSGPQQGLLAAWRRLTPMLRLRANRYVETDPRGAAHPAASGARRSGPGDAPEPQTADPVTRGLEDQIHLIYERLTGASDIQEDELRRGLEAAEVYITRHGAWRRAPVWPTPPTASDLVETPSPSMRQAEPLLRSIKQGTGTRGLAFIGLIGAILEARDRFPLAEDARPLLVLEDVEAHLHPTTLAAMWELISKLPAQKILTTNSGELLAAVPLRAIRRIETDALGTRVHRIDVDRYSVDDLRRIAYHVRINRAGALFARCWLFVEGETEAWLLPELAQLCGFDFPSEGVRCVEFAQSGLRALLRLANDLGIEWHMLADGDEAGHSYVVAARAHLKGRRIEDRITLLEEPDIEHCLFQHGYADLYRSLAGAPPSAPRGRRFRERPANIIARAIHARSKPGLALAVLETANKPGGPGVPWQLRSLIETVVRLARPAV